MKISEFKKSLNTIKELNFIQLNGKFVPKHFHVTEVGLISKHYIDCGGTERKEKKVSFQLWVAGDLEHRLTPQKLYKIIEQSNTILGNEDLEIEVEYQTETISKFNVFFDGKNFNLFSQSTNCLATDKCGIKPEHLAVNTDLLGADCCAGEDCC